MSPLHSAIHYGEYGPRDATACGRATSKTNCTLDKSRVTCGHCKRWMKEHRP